MRWLGYVGLLLLVLRVVAGCAAVTYGQALADCREEGKAVNSYSVYEQCAREADKRFGLVDGGAR